MCRLSAIPDKMIVSAYLLQVITYAAPFWGYVADLYIKRRCTSFSKSGSKCPVDSLVCTSHSSEPSFHLPFRWRPYHTILNNLLSATRRIDCTNTSAFPNHINCPRTVGYFVVSLCPVMFLWVVFRIFPAELLKIFISNASVLALCKSVSLLVSAHI